MANQEDAGEMISEKAKKISRGEMEAAIMTLMNQKPILSYHEDVEKTNPLHNVRRTEDEVARAWMSGVISKSDLFIIEAVYRLSFATVDMIAKMLKILKIKNPDKLIPVVSPQAVKSRVIELSNNGILGGCKYTVIQDGKKSSVIVYACLHNGFRLLKKQFGFPVYQDDMLLALNDVEIFSRVACSYCALAVASIKKDEITDISGYGEDKSFGKDFRPQLYACIRVKNEDETFRRIAFEPLYHNYDADIMRAEDASQRHLARLNGLLKWVLKCETVLNEKAKIVIVCEDRKGIIRALNLIHANIPDIEPYISFTTEMILRNLARKNDELVMHGFLRLYYDDKGICSHLDEI